MPYTGRFCNYRKYLPRACGDVPISIDPAYKEQGFTPRLRGCTQFAVDHLQGHPIYPAPAGVYLLAVCCTDFSGDLPRACGDIPPTEYKRQHGLRFTPRLRGCTQERRASDFAAAIYPAPAGMYLVHFSLRVLKGNLPRACGDVPYDTDNDGKLDLFTPRLRGCTSIAKGGGPNQLAIPATWGCSYATPAKFANTITPRRCG